MTKITHRLPRAEFVYVGRKSCGCVVGIASDYADKFTGRAVAEFITDGLTVERVSLEKYREEISNEPTFMKCQHVKKEPEQIKLFEVDK